MLLSVNRAQFQELQALITGLPLTSCIILEKLLNFPLPQFLAFEKEKNSYTYVIGLSNNKVVNSYKVLGRVPGIQNVFPRAPKPSLPVIPVPTPMTSMEMSMI